MAEMMLVKLAVVFVVIIVLLLFHLPLNISILGGVVLHIILFKVPPAQCLHLVSNVFTSWSSLSILIALYLITLLQRILSRQRMIEHAYNDLNDIFHNRRVTAVCAPMFIGLLPSAGAMKLAGDIIRDSTEGYLDPKEQAFCTTWIRHIPESTMPTYPCVLLIAEIAGVPLSAMLTAMILPVAVLILVSYFPYLKRIPRQPENHSGSQNKGKSFLQLIYHLWPLLLILFMILVFKVDTVISMLISVILCIVVYRYKWSDLKSMLVSAFEPKLILNSLLVLILKEFIADSGVVQVLPEMLSGLPIPSYLIFAIMFIFGSFISGATAIVAMGAPLAFAALTGMPALPLLILLNCINHAVTQLAPTHICIVVAADYFKVGLGDVIKKTVRPAVIFLLFAFAYYHLLMLFV